MSRWYRAYEGTVTDSKLAEVSLIAGTSRSVVIATWHAILENCATINERGRFDISPRRVAAALVEPVEAIEKVFAGLSEVGLTVDDGVSSWSKRQFESDSSTERSRKHREASRNVDATLQQQHATPPETETETETETYTETEKKEKTLGRSQKTTRPKASIEFEEFWKVYPRRLGANPKAPSFKLFDAAVKQGADPQAIIEGARRCAADDHDKIGTPFIPQAVKWLRDRRWEDYAAAPPGSPGMSEIERKKLFEELRNGGLEKAGRNLRPTGDGSRKIEWMGRQEPTIVANNQGRHAGMVGLGTILQAPSGFRAGRDEAGSEWAEPGNDGPGPMARAV